MNLVNECTTISNTAQQRYSEMDVITRSVGAAVVNLQTHVQNLVQKCNDARTWAAEVLRDHQSLLENWERSLGQLRTIPATAPMIRFIVGRDPRNGKQQACLEDLIDLVEVRRAADVAKRAAAQFERGVAELESVMDELTEGTNAIGQKSENGVARSSSERSGEPTQLMEDIEAIARKVDSDYESVLGFQNTPKNVSQASKSALLHTKNFLPNLRKRYLEMHDLLRQATEVRNEAAVESVEVMQSIAMLNSMCTEVADRLSSLDVAPEEDKAFALLQLVHQLPAVYASFVSEAIRRREWSEKIKSDSSTIANEVAAFQDEEERRRKKWQKSTGALFWADKNEGKAMGLEVNLLGDGEQWPLASREDLEQLLQALKSQDSRPDVISAVSQIMEELNRPTKQQIKTVKGFKNGSFHEAVMSRSALLARSEDNLVRDLQQQNSKLEQKLKGSESRVRRLEDLLHRQSVASRSSTGFQPPATPIIDRHDVPASPRVPDYPSRPGSAASRRFSATQGPDEKALVQRLIVVEAELIAERERAAGLEKEVSAKTNAHNEIKGLVAEANSTKKDLMENLEAQQREFGIERQSLEAEIKKLKAKLEEYEDDMDRIMGSRDQVDERVRLMQQELEKVRAESAAETDKAQGQVDFLRNDAKLQRESNEALERQLQVAREEAVESKKRAQQAELDGDKRLQDLYGVLLSNEERPTDSNELVESLLARWTDMVGEVEMHKRDVELARHDRQDAQTTLTNLKGELSTMRVQYNKMTTKFAESQETLEAERAKFMALVDQLVDEREQLTLLRNKFAEGETGSEALRNRIQEEEQSVATLSEELAANRSRVGSLEDELHSAQEQLQTSHMRYEKLSERFEARTLRAKELTQRLYTQNDRLIRLLDRLSYSVTRQNGTMTITKNPRAERSRDNNNADSSDPGSSMRRSLSGATSITKALADSADLSTLYWMEGSPSPHSSTYIDGDIETRKYDSFLSTLGCLDVDSFSDILLKRLRDTEHTLRKYTLASRTYRDKSHAYQQEASQKIAYRHFGVGDLALFLPTRNQAMGAWAAFNVGAPHYFLREREGMGLARREWLVARITSISERVVDLSKSLGRSATADKGSIGENESFEEDENDNPFELSDGLRWYLLDAVEERAGTAPSTPGLGKSTVATTSVDAQGAIMGRQQSSSSHRKGLSIGGGGGERGMGSVVEGVSKTLSRSLDSRRSSVNSKKGVAGVVSLLGGGGGTGTPKTKGSVSEVVQAEVGGSRRGSVTSQAATGGIDPSTGATAALPRSGSSTAMAPPPLPSNLRTGGSNLSQEVRPTPLDDLLGP